MSESVVLYHKVTPNPDFAKLEEVILDRWRKEDTFKRSVKGDAEFIFYDGPPFANGLPHYGHLLTGFVKDLFARYQAILGKKVERRFGWDCHGLPAEMKAQKELGISGKVAIEKFGINKFNDHCRTSVMKYTKEWEYYINRQARWVDFADDYKTMDRNYMESVIWAFGELYKKGLIYESLRVMPYSWACETPVSDFETRMDNSYREKVSKATTVKFLLISPLKAAPSGLKDYHLLVWTTTPWTLPSNLAIAVGNDIDYVCIDFQGSCLIIAEALAKSYENEIGTNVVGHLKGSDLVGLSYQPLFPYFKNNANAFKIFAADFVNTDEGTGIVHMAPGFGEDDYNLCKQHGIEIACPVDSAGKFVYPVTDYEGLQVFETEELIIKRLKQENKWIKTGQYIHNYPHCWRTDTPLIYKAVPSWYVKVTAIKDKMINNNQKINWIPDHIKNGIFGKWLENARDWSISRNRYWGCPIPVWVSDDPKYPHIEVYGSIKELEAAFNVEVTDLHRPFIDTLVKPNPKDPTGKSIMKRVPDVLDCWFESGSMPFAQVHYPFENKDWFDHNFPADFIVEYIGQTRGWFYTLIILSSALFDRPPFLNCICHGVILGDDGQKISKRLNNYVDPKEIFNQLGADALRWYMISSSVMRGQELVIDKEHKGVKEALKNAIKPVWNAFNFFTLYANSDKIKAEFNLTSTNILDRYILSKCCEAIAVVKSSLDRYDTIEACHALENLFEVLNNWYIRRSRERFWKSEKDQDKINAYNTLYSVLLLICRSASPLLPMILEEIYLNLTDHKNSVHLENFPQINYAIDSELIAQMERVRDACTAALFIRNESGIRVRQPLESVTFIGVAGSQLDETLIQLILDEVNVKTWHNLDKSKIADYANYQLKINFPSVGKRIPKKIKDIITAQKQNLWERKDGQLLIANEELREDEYQLLLEPKSEFKGAIAALSSNDAMVLLDLDLTQDLKLEGIARDLVRAIQQRRRDMELQLTDKIEVFISSADDNINAAVAKWESYIKEQTLSNSIQCVSKLDSDNVINVEIDGAAAIIEMKKSYIFNEDIKRTLEGSSDYYKESEPAVTKVMSGEDIEKDVKKKKSYK